MHGIANVMTGAGKTILSISAIGLLSRKYPRLRTRIVVPTVMLVRQWKDALAKYSSDFGFSYSLGEWHGKSIKTHDCDITVYVINSARNSLAAHILDDFKCGHPVFLVADECHHYGSPENGRIFDFIPKISYPMDNYFSLGLSATPFSESNRSKLISGLGKQIYRYQVQSASSDGIISPYSIFEISVPFLSEELSEYGKLTLQMNIIYKKLLCEYPHLGELGSTSLFFAIKNLAAEEDDTECMAYLYLSLSLSRKRLSTMAKSRLSCVLALISRTRRQQQILVFCERISQAEELKNLLYKSGFIRVSLYHSKMSKEARATSLEHFREHYSNILISCRALDEGMDVPDASIGIIMSSTSVERQRIQRLGRILRRFSEKDMASLYYIYVKESSDDNIFLPDIADSSIHRLSYSFSENSFVNEEYESLACRLLSEIGHEISPEQKPEFMQCITEGQTNHDWLLPPETLLDILSATTDTHERNYYTLMHRISEYRRCCP